MTVDTRSKVQRGLAAGKNASQIARELGITKSTVCYHRRRLGYEIDDRCNRRYDWLEVQRYYDAGHSKRECQSRFGFTSKTWYEAVQRGAIMPRSAAAPIETYLVAGRNATNRSHLKLRLLAAGLKENRCERCGITAWLGDPLNMALHHINGDGSDNRLENISFLCPNCHAQTPNYGGKNGHRRKRVSTASP